MNNMKDLPLSEIQLISALISPSWSILAILVFLISEFCVWVLPSISRPPLVLYRSEYDPEHQYDLHYHYQLISTWIVLSNWSGSVSLYTMPQYPGSIHPRKFPGENEAYKISDRWKRFGFSTSPVCIDNLSHPERNF